LQKCKRWSLAAWVSILIYLRIFIFCGFLDYNKYKIPTLLRFYYNNLGKPQKRIFSFFIFNKNKLI
jgi:hypothetical protein